MRNRVIHENKKTFSRAFDNVGHYEIYNASNRPIYIKLINGKPLIARGKDRHDALILKPHEYLSNCAHAFL